VRSRFRGEIAGIGSSSGVRVVVGRWESTPLGAFGDAMVETATGHRVLLAPSQEVADFIAATYTFDEVRLEPFEVSGTGDRWTVRSPSLSLDLTAGRRTPLGWALHALPRRLAESPAWCTLTDPVARVVLRGVRTKGTAGGDRREYYEPATPAGWPRRPAASTARTSGCWPTSTRRAGSASPPRRGGRA
jgi:hypothetical protein